MYISHRKRIYSKKGFSNVLKSVQEEFFLDVPRAKGSNMTSLQNYVQVDAANEQEYIVVKDRDKKHTVFIVFIDRRKVDTIRDH